ncbi:MAG: hypothetical protein P1P86_02780 [Bacteroidales bacterium]|nr:hypothetical protein [Bacteroidales bacterium]
MRNIYAFMLLLGLSACDSGTPDPAVHIPDATFLDRLIAEGADLNLSNNSLLTKIGVDNMPMLTGICVWTLPFPPEGVVVLQGYSPNINFTTACLAH